MSVVKRYPLAVYFVLVYALSVLALAVVGPPRLDGGGGRPTASLVMFPIMVVGVGLAGLGLTAMTGGRRGLQELRDRLRRWRVPARWFALLLIPPAGILAVLSALRVLVSPAFAPQLLVFGLFAGVFAGFCEEIGWSGFAYPRMSARWGARTAACLLGLLWGLWHLPIVDSLGAASPHGAWWPAFFAAFVGLIAAVRVLICWVYTNTGSVFLAQLIHASSTAFLVILSAPAVTPAQEALWYGAYAAVLWVVAAGAMVLWSPWGLRSGGSETVAAKATNYART